MAEMERDFSQYLLTERGLTPRTVSQYAPYLHRFLSRRFGRGPLRLEALRPADIIEHLLRESQRSGPANGKVTVTVLRHFLRFLRLRGSVQADMSQVLPPVHHWRLSTLPKYLHPEQVQSLLASCNQHEAIGQRNFTVMLLLARLGLRAGEVAQMRLEDIDWDRGELIIRGKRGYHDRLPLLPDVGQALARYLREGRPACTSRHVFVRMHAPHRPFRTSSPVTFIVATALQRVGLKPPRGGARILRHTLATQMLRGGASLLEVGDVLRHRDIDTTGVYAKVDVQALRALAQPWAGDHP